MARRRFACTSLVLVLAVVAISLAGCVSTTSPHTSTKVQLAYVLQHTATPTLAPGKTASATASCASGETLVSGGYSTDAAQKGATQGAIASYPSDSAGTPPSTQGQPENSWTVRAVNSTAGEVDYQVSVNCASGFPISSGVWYQPFTLWQNLGYGATVYCPGAPTNVLVGGGYDRPAEAAEVVDVAEATTDQGVDSQGWWVMTGGGPGGTAFAVCAKGKSITAEPPVWAYQDTVNQLGVGHYQGEQGVSCAQDEVLVGGGFYVWYDWQGTWPLSDDSLTSDTPLQWRMGFNSTGVTYDAPQSNMAGVEAICIRATPGKLANITFSNYHHLIRIPADVIVATDGSGQIRAGKLTAHVSQARSHALDAVKMVNPFTGGVSYTVPSGCGSPTPATDAATNAVTAQLKRTAPPAGQTVFGSPAVTIDHTSLTCSPKAGTQRTAPFTYTQAIDATATQGTYDPKAVVSYQYNQLQKGTQALGSPYVLRDTLMCPGRPKLVSATSTRATLQCAAYGVADWPWSTDQLHTLAQMIAGKTIADAQQILDTTPGIEAHSAVINLPDAADAKLPTDANDITIIVVRTQDTAPVIRAP